MNLGLNAALSVMENGWHNIEKGHFGDPMRFDEESLIRMAALGQGIFDIIERAASQHAVLGGKPPSYTVHTGEAFREKLRQRAERDRN